MMVILRSVAFHCVQRVQLFLVVLLLESSIPTSNAWVAERFRNGFGYFYMINGYAMDSLDAYEVVVVKNLCLCRQRCEVVPKCHSVSAIPNGTGEVECRLSLKPLNLSDVDGRSELNRETGAFHFLQTSKNAWEKPEVDGLMYATRVTLWADGKQACSQIYPPHSFAICNTPEQFEVMKKYADTGDINIWARKRAQDTEPAFGPVASPVPYSHAGLDVENLSELNLNQECLKLILRKIGESYKFVCLDIDNERTTLCQRNPLHINW